MAPLIDSYNKANDSNAHTSLNGTITCVGNNLDVFFLTSVESDSTHTAQTVSSVVCGGLSGVNVTSKYVTGNTDNGCEIWRVSGVNSGSNNFTVTYTGEVDGSFAAAIAVSGANKSNPVNDTGVGETTPAGASVSATLDITSPYCLILNIVHGTATATTLTKDTNDTQLYNEATTGDHIQGVAYRYVTDAGQYTSTWTASPNDVMSICAVAIRPENNKPGNMFRSAVVGNGMARNEGAT